MTNVLAQIQAELKAPKNQMNKFGGYKYRSCEDIVEAAKPLCAKHGLALVISDEIVAVLDRVYVKATSCLVDDSGKVIATTSAYARESETKKGMDDSQITGSASSYARKYSLNGLFAIDDTKDADATNDHSHTQVSPEPINYDKVEKAYAYIVSVIDNDELDDVAAAEQIQKGWKRLSQDEQIKVNEKLKDIKNGKKQYNTILREYLAYRLGGTE